MNIDVARTVVVVIVLTLLSGFGDAQGFFHASNIWVKGKFISFEAVKSGIGYIFGTVMYWFALKYLAEIKVISPEIQFAGWFVVAYVGVAILSGKIAQWHVIDQVVALAVFIGFVWLFFRTGG